MNPPDHEILRLESQISELRTDPTAFGAKRRLAHLLLKLAGLYASLGRKEHSHSALGSAIEVLSRLKGPFHPAVLELKNYLEQASLQIFDVRPSALE